MESLVAHFQDAIGWFRTTHPAFLIVAIAILPLVGVPVSPFLILSGVRLGPLWGTVASCGALLINATLGYWLAAGWFRSGIEKLLARRGRTVPVLAKEDEWKFILVCRITPGFPLPLQNYVLGCARVNFTRYILLSLPAQWAYAFAFAYFGESLTHGSAWRIALAVSLLVALALTVSLLRRWWKKRCQVGATPESGE